MELAPRGPFDVAALFAIYVYPITNLTQCQSFQMILTTSVPINLSQKSLLHKIRFDINSALPGASRHGLMSSAKFRNKPEYADSRC